MTFGVSQEHHISNKKSFPIGTIDSLYIGYFTPRLEFPSSDPRKVVVRLELLFLAPDAELYFGLQRVSHASTNVVSTPKSLIEVCGQDLMLCMNGNTLSNRGACSDKFCS